MRADSAFRLLRERGDAATLFGGAREGGARGAGGAGRGGGAGGDGAPAGGAPAGGGSGAGGSGGGTSGAGSSGGATSGGATSGGGTSGAGSSGGATSGGATSGGGTSGGGTSGGGTSGGDLSAFGGVPTVVHRSVTRPALVLGSTMSASVVAVDPPVDVVRRRSGGGAVLVEPDGVVWVDVFVPAGHELWDPDVGRAFWWLGDAWARALADLGVPDVLVHRGPLVTTAWSPLVCFAGLGPGEVTVAGGGKVVGIAQRRTREGSLFQCALARSWAPERLLALFELPLEEFERGLSELEHVVTPLEREPEECLLALFEHLPA